MIDVIIGTLLNYIYLNLFFIFFSYYFKYKFESGDYGEKASKKNWAYQIIIWIFILTMVNKKI